MLSVLDLSHHDSREKLDKVLHKLKWNDFPGLQALLLKVTYAVICRCLIRIMGSSKNKMRAHITSRQEVSIEMAARIRFC